MRFKDRYQKIISLISGFISTVFIIFSIYAQLPVNPVTSSIDKEYRNAWTRIYPQGWQFFTKDTDDPEMTVYQIEDKKIQNISRFPNSSIDNLLGFSRAQRAQGTEVGAISLQVDEWKECPTDGSDCILESISSNPQVVDNPSKTKTVCGDVVLVVTIPVPFEYSHYYSGWRLDQSASHVKVNC